MNEKSMVENFEDAVFASEHCNPDLNSVGKFVLSNLPHEEGFKVVLSGQWVLSANFLGSQNAGEGSDEHFGGYQTFLPDFFREPDLAWPGPAMSKSEREHIALEKERQTTAGFKGSDQNLVTQESLVARRMLNNTSISSHMWAVTMAHFAPWTKCYGAFSRQQARAHTPDVHVLNLMNSKWHPLHTSQYIWIKSTLTNWILTCMGDRMEMAHSIEGRTPFLDHVLTEYVNALPPSMKIRYDPASGEVIEKWILREAGKPFITEEIYKRKKHPFTAPILYPTGGHMHQMLSRLVTKENVLQLGFVDWEKAEGLIDKAFGEKKDPSAMRYAMTIAQWVVLSHKFGVARAEPPGGGSAESKGALGKIWGVVKSLWSKFV